MRRIPYLLIVLVVFGVVLLASTPEKPLQALPPGCFCAGPVSTPEFCGSGATCDEAKASILAQAEPYVDCFGESTCGKTLVLTVGCHLCEGQIMAQGYVNYRCWICDPPY